MPLFPLDTPDLSLDAVTALARDLLPNEDVVAVGLASNEKSNNIMYKVRTKEGHVYGLKFFRRDTLFIEKTARQRALPVTSSAPFLADGRCDAVAPYPYAIFRWIPGEIIFDVMGKLRTEAETDSLARQLASILAGFARTNIEEFPMPPRFDLENLIPFLREHYEPHLAREDTDRILDYCAGQTGELRRYYRESKSLVHGALQENVVIERQNGELQVTGIIDWEHVWQGQPILDYLFLMEGIGTYPMKQLFQERLYRYCTEQGFYFPRDTMQCFILTRCFILADKVDRAGFMSDYVRLHTEILLEEIDPSR